MLLRFVFLFACLLLGAHDGFAATKKRSAKSNSDSAPLGAPNFIVINIDDMGYADIGPFGSTLNRTPNLNRMAQEGMKLTCHYAAPVCSPSRASLMTGCYPKRVLPIPHVLFPGSAVGLNPEERTVAEVLKDAGYTTACIGKWHLGDQPEFLPTRQGFDYYYGIPYSNDMGPGQDGSKSSLGDRLPVRKADAKTAIEETGIRGEQPPLPLLRNEQVIARVRAQEQTELVARYTDEAVKFITENKAKRFFLYLPHNAVHFPIYPGKNFQGKSKNGNYGDWVEEVDWSVGKVFGALREQGLDAKTFVLFTSDNGGTPRAVNAPLRGFKTTTWEGGMRVPTIAWWPGKIAAGSTCNTITSMADVLPTLAKLGGGKLPANKIDGHDLWPLLSGQTKQTPWDVFYFYRGLALEAVRQGPWKLHLAKTELYNLDTDIGEKTNLAKDKPDIVAQLQALAEQTKDDLGKDGIGPGCRPLGKVQNPQPLIGK
jgi:arylsulfatase A